MSVPQHAPFGGMQASFHHTLSPCATLPSSYAKPRPPSGIAPSCAGFGSTVGNAAQRKWRLVACPVGQDRTSCRMPGRTRCALLYTALSLVCLAVTSAGRLPKSAPPRSSRSAAAHPVAVRMSTRCRAASKRDMHASILRTCSAGTPIQKTFVPVRTCVTGPLRWAAAHSHVGLLLEHSARNVPLQRRSLKLCALAAAKKVVDVEAQKLVCSHTCTCVRRHARASACE